MLFSSLSLVIFDPFYAPLRGFSMYQWLINFSWRTVTSWLLNEWSWLSVTDSFWRTLSKFIKKSAAELISTFMMMTVNVCSLWITCVVLCWTNKNFSSLKYKIYSLNSLYVFLFFLYFLFFTFQKKALTEKIINFFWWMHSLNIQFIDKVSSSIVSQMEYFNNYLFKARELKRKNDHK